MNPVIPSISPESYHLALPAYTTKTPLRSLSVRMIPPTSLLADR